MKRLGLDIGHCMSSGAYFEINKTRPTKIDVVSGQSTIPTQFELTNEQLMKLQEWEKNAIEQMKEFKNQEEDIEIYPGYDFLNSLGDIIIGNKVPVVVEYGRAFQYFKTVPENFGEFFGVSPDDKKRLNLRYGTLMACFCYALMKSYIKHGQVFDENDRENLKLIVGCPSTRKWTSDEAKEKYAKLIKNATGVAQVEIVPESRGALFGVSNEKKGILVADGVVVFDFGSLTADSTYMLTGVRMAEFSWELGASFIEKEMTNLAIENIKNGCKESGEIASISDSNCVRAYRELRTEKEKYFNNQYGTEGNTYTFKFKDANGQTKGKSINIDEEYMNKVINERKITIDCGNFVEKTGSWVSLCKEFFETAKNKIINIEKLPVKTIVLTGGASQMGFIANICEEVFGIKPLMDENVEFAVANGLAWVSLSEEKYPEIFEKALTDLKGKVAINPKTLQSDMANVLTDYLLSEIMKEAKKWANEDENASANDLIERCTKRFDSEQAKDKIRNMIDSQFNVWKNNTNDEIVKIVNKYTKEIFTEEITNSLCYNASKVDKEFELSGVNISSIIDTINFDSFGDKIEKLMVVIFHFVLTIFTYGFWLFANLAFGGETVADENKDEKLSKKVRQYILKSLEKKRAQRKLKKKINKEVYNELTWLNDDIMNICESSLEKAFKVAMLMDFEKTGWSDDDE